MSIPIPNGSSPARQNGFPEEWFLLHRIALDSRDVASRDPQLAALIEAHPADPPAAIPNQAAVPTGHAADRAVGQGPGQQPFRGSGVEVGGERVGHRRSFTIVSASPEVSRPTLPLDTRLKSGESLPNTKRVHCRRITRSRLLDHPTTAKRVLAHA